MKKYLKKKGIKVAAIALAAVIVIAVVAGALGGRTSLVENLSGSIRKPLQNMITPVAQWLEGIYGYMYEYDSLQAENEALRTKLAQAEEKARDGEEALKENERLRELLGFKEKHKDFVLESARVLARTASNWSSTFTIGKGESSGIALGDPVITEYGALVGQITELGTDWATVSTVIDAGTSIGAIASEAGSTGMIMGDYGLMKEGLIKLTYLPDGSQLFVGDTILTSGAGGSFPEGLVIGAVASVQSEAGGQIEFGLVEPSCDLNALVQVFVVKDFDVVR